jgi:D-aminopeptidase
VGLARTGSYFGHGSGDVFLGFCTANRMKTEGSKMLPLSCLPEERLEDVFRLMAEAVEEAVLNSLTEAQPAQFLDGRTCHSLAEFLGRCR